MVMGGDVARWVLRDVAILAVAVVGGRLEVVTGSVELVSAWVDDGGAVEDVVEVGGAELEVEGCALRRRVSAIG